MKKTFLILMIFAAILTSCKNQTSNTDNKKDISAAKAFTSEKYNFSAIFPEKPKESSNSTITEGEKINISMFVYESNDQAFFVGISDMPKNLVDKSDKKTLLQSAKTGALQHLTNSKILNEKNISLGAHPGLEFDVTGKSGDTELYMKGRYYMVDNRLYQIYVMAQKSDSKKMEADKIEINRFIDSFKLIAQSKLL